MDGFKYNILKGLNTIAFLPHAIQAETVFLTASRA